MRALSAKSKRRRQLSALLRWRLRDANERDSCSFYTSKACVFTGATFNDGDFGASVRGFTPQKSGLFLDGFFSLIAFEVCLPEDEVLFLADTHIINWRLWHGWRWQLELRVTQRDQSLRKIDATLDVKLGNDLFPNIKPNVTSLQQ